MEVGALSHRFEGLSYTPPAAVVACPAHTLPGVIRHADPDRDAATCTAIYAPSVDDGFASFEESVPDAAEVGRRIAAAAATHAWLVAERGGAVVGFAYAGPHRSRDGYRWAADVSAYVAADHRGTGVARELYASLLGLLGRQRLRVACAGIALPNPASVRLHESFGFVAVARYPQIGWKAGAWRDVGWWQLELAPPGEGPPAEPLGPQRLGDGSPPRSLDRASGVVAFGSGQTGDAP